MVFDYVAQHLTAGLGLSEIFEVGPGCQVLPLLPLCLCCGSSNPQIPGGSHSGGGFDTLLSIAGAVVVWVKRLF